MSGPQVDLAKLRPRQQWLLWFVFHSDKNKKRKLMDICSPEEHDKLSKKSETKNVEHRSLCPEDHFKQTMETAEIAMDLKNASVDNPVEASAEEHSEQDPSNASDAISQASGGESDEEFSHDFLFGVEKSD